MEHSLSSAELVRPWRVATLVASAIAAIELVLLIVLAVAMLGRPVAKSVRAAASQQVLAPARPQALQPAGPRLTRGETAVLVLNGNGRTGAAAEAAARVESLGYPVSAVGNAPRDDYARTLVMFRPGYRAEAARLAKEVGADVVAPLDGAPARELAGARVVLVLGSG